MKKVSYIVGIIAMIVMIGSALDSCGGSKEKDPSNRSLTEILDENDFAAANKYLSDINIPHGNLGYYDTNKVIVKNYLPAAIKILKAEATYLMDADDPEAETLFQLCINDVAGNIGTYQPKLGFFDGNSQTETEYLMKEITPYNACLLSIIKEALIKNKPEFAKKVFKLMKTNYKCEEKTKPGTIVDHYTYTYDEDNSQIEEAQKLISDYENNQ